MTVSIVTISYNQGRYLEDAVRSVLRQREDGVNLQYIVVDAVSTDGSQQILHKYARDIDLLIVEPDQGPADGLNKGFEHATGDVLGFLNADDLLEPGALRLVTSFLATQPSIDAVTGSLRIADERRRRFYRVVVPAPFDLRRFSGGCYLTLQQSTFFRRTAWESTSGFNPTNATCWDGELFAEMIAGGVTFGTISNILATFRIHDASITGSGGQSVNNSMRYVEDQRRIRRLYADPTQDAETGLTKFKRLGWKLRPVLRGRGAIAGLRDWADHKPTVWNPLQR